MTNPWNADDERYWRTARLATRDHCNRCPHYYDELSPECANARIHERYTAEQEAKTATPEKET